MWKVEINDQKKLQVWENACPRFDKSVFRHLITRRISADVDKCEITGYDPSKIKV